MKRMICFATFSLCFLLGNAQIGKPAVQDNAYGNALAKIVLDYKSNFTGMQADKIADGAEAIEYKSKICLPGAVSCKVMRYRSAEDKTANWQAFIYGGEKYEEALKQYKKTFELVKKTKVPGIDAAPASFEGQLDKADENVRFAVSSLRLKTKNGVYKNLVVDVELLSNYDGWEVHLNIYTKKLETEEEN